MQNTALIHFLPIHYFSFIHTRYLPLVTPSFLLKNIFSTFNASVLNPEVDN